MFPFFLNAQSLYSEYAGAKVSAIVSFGTHQRAIGLELSGYAGTDFAQLSASSRYMYFFKNLGSRCHFGEWKNSLGAQAIWGKQRQSPFYEWGTAFHKSNRPYSLGYLHIWYKDKVGTSQRSGAWNVGIQRFDIQFENDVWAGQAKDRFRSGNLFISYRDSLQKIGLGIQIWTGETAGSPWIHTTNEKMPSGYRDISNRPYGYLNHGILYLEYQRLIGFEQFAGARIGWDSEQIRHAVQNRFTHDLVILPKKFPRNTPHYPRLDTFGNPVFTKKDTRPAMFYGSVFLNSIGLY